MTKLVPRNTTLPTSKSETFSTAADGQTSVEINVLQGEREFVKDNKSLGTFRLDGIPPAPRGVPQIEVKTDIKITGASTLSDDEVNRMVNDAEKNADEDSKKREEVDTRNQADSMVYQTEKQITELGDKVPAEMKTKVEGKLNELKEAIASGSVEGMKSAQDSLQQEVMAMGQAMYSEGGGADAGGAAPGAEGEAAGASPESNDDDVVD